MEIAWRRLFALLSPLSLLTQDLQREMECRLEMRWECTLSKWQVRGGELFFLIASSGSKTLSLTEWKFIWGNRSVTLHSMFRSGPWLNFCEFYLQIYNSLRYQGDHFSVMRTSMKTRYKDKGRKQVFLMAASQTLQDLSSLTRDW